MKYLFASVLGLVGVSAFAGDACQVVTSASHVVAVNQPVYVQRQVVAIEQPVYVQRVAVAQPVYVQRQFVAVQQHRQVVAVNNGFYGNQQFVQGNRFGGGRVGNGGNNFGNLLNAVFDPRTLGAAGGAVAGTLIAGPGAGLAGAGIGSAVGSILGGALGGR